MTAAAAAASLILAACGATGSRAADEYGCGRAGAVDGSGLQVAATVSPITNIVATIAAGSGVSVAGVVPEGVDSHTFEPTPAVVAVLENADVVFMNGLGLELPTEKLARANIGDDGEICQLGNSVLLPDDYLYDRAFPEEAGYPNPHLWTDPMRALEYAGVIRDTLSARDPSEADVFNTNYQRFRVEVERFDAATRASIDTIEPSRRQLLTYHDAYAYFAKRYGFTVVAAVQPSSFDEPTPREVAALIEQVKQTGVQAIFGSEVFPSPVLAQVAAATGAEYVDDLRDDDLPGAPGDADHSWLALMRFNLVTIIEALGGDAGALRALEFAPSVDEATYPQ